MARKINTDGQVGWVAWGSLIICMAALFVILHRTLAEALDSQCGVIAITAAAMAGLITAARCRRFGLLTGLTLPVVFGLGLALHLVTGADFMWRMTGLVMGIYLSLVGGRVAMHLIYIDQRSRERHWLQMFCIVLLPVVLVAGFKYFWKYVVDDPNGLEIWSLRIVLCWGLLLMVYSLQDVLHFTVFRFRRDKPRIVYMT